MGQNKPHTLCHKKCNGFTLTIKLSVLNNKMENLLKTGGMGKRI